MCPLNMILHLSGCGQEHVVCLGNVKVFVLYCKLLPLFLYSLKSLASHQLEIQWELSVHYYRF